MGSNRSPDLTEIIEEMITSNRKSMFGGWLPGRIESFDSSKSKASIQILLLETVENESGTVKRPVAVINEVPVLTFNDHHGLRVELDLQKGDTVMVCFAARDTDRWRQRGGMIDPANDRDHDLNDAVAIPMLFDFAHVKKPTAKIKFTQSAVEIGGTSALAKASDLTALKNAISSADTTTVATFKAAILAALTSWPNPTSVIKGG